MSDIAVLVNASDGRDRVAFSAALKRLVARGAELERERDALREMLAANLNTMRAVASKLSSRQPTVAENMLRQRMIELEAALSEEADVPKYDWRYDVEP